MSGPGIRYFHLATELARDAEVTLVAPGVGDLKIRNVETISLPAGSWPTRVGGLSSYDAVVTRPLPFAARRWVTRAAQRVIYDLYVPILSEQLAALSVQREHPAAEIFHRMAMLDVRHALTTGDAFICASERQRDFWLGMLATLRRVEVSLYAADPTLRRLIDVVPFGIEDEGSHDGSSVIRRTFPHIGAGDRVLLWGGGVWNWLDPVTPIRAVAKLAGRRDDVKLVFLALRHPDVALASAAERAVTVAESLGVAGSHVFFNERWVDYDARRAFLLEADIGVSAHYDTLETRYAYRARLLDYFWAGLPTVTTRGDVLGDLVHDRGLGASLAPEDVDGWVSAIERLLDDTDERNRIGERLTRLRAELSWANAAAPLRRLVSAESDRRRAVVARGALEFESLALRTEAAYSIGGARGAASRQLAKVRRRLRPRNE